MDRFLDTRLVMQTDGNLVACEAGRARFATSTQGNPGAAAILQADGNFIVDGPGNEVLFASGTAGQVAHGEPLLLVSQGSFQLGDDLNSEDQLLFDALWTTSTVLPGGRLLGVVNDRRTSPAGRFRLSLSDRGNLSVLGDRGVRYSSRTRGSDAIGVMQDDGIFVVYAGQRVLFQTRTAGNPGARLVVQDDGNLVLYSPTNRALFSTLR